MTLPSLVSAQPCGSHPVTVAVQCRADLLGGAQTRSLDASAPPMRLSMQAAGRQANIAMGDHSLSAGLVCSSGRDQQMAYALEVRLTKKGRPFASPLHLAMLRNMGLDQRAGQPPLTVESYFFFDQGMALEGVKYTRLDYACWVTVKGP